MLDITPAEACDSTEIIALRYAAEDWLAQRGIDQWAPRETPESVFRQQIDAGEFFVARLSDRPKIIGALRLIWRDPVIWQELDTFAGYIHSLVVSRNHTGLGIGREMLEWAAHSARHAGADLLRLDCAETNLPLSDYYRRNGFNQVGRRELHNPQHKVALFERRLTSSMIDTYTRVDRNCRIDRDSF
ncbi:GNAT family N-acetyltransferase [Nocardia sp. NPDC051750]|uniref:GNAT family N-acetyltransferase n=1 Tax=Nocardia sp. NPDC051750 TaxID=3364325 RepID=UPI0037A5BE78